MLKRCFDLLASLVLIAILLPLILIIAGCCLFYFGSPILFKQVRIGLNNQKFILYKFRTMVNAHDQDGNLLPDAQRLTTFGYFLRSTSLDELPQLFNVFKDQLSLVGPRPLLPEYLPLYSAEQARRHDIKPGITGWAQVNGRNAISWEEKFKLDIWYIEHQSLILDLNILWLTFLNIIQRKAISQPGEATMKKLNGALDKIIIIGASGHAKIVASAALSAGITVLGFYDDNLYLKDQKILGIPVLGTLADLYEKQNFQSSVIGIGDNIIRRKIAEKFTQLNWKTIIHPFSSIDKTVQLGAGSVVFAGAIVQVNAILGNHCIINTAASIDHDALIGNYVHIGPGSHLAGNVKLADEVFLGVGVSMIPQVEIHANTTVGAALL